MHDFSPRHIMQLSVSPRRSAVTPWKKITVYRPSSANFMFFFDPKARLLENLIRAVRLSFIVEKYRFRDKQRKPLLISFTRVRKTAIDYLDILVADASKDFANFLQRGIGVPLWNMGENVEEAVRVEGTTRLVCLSMRYCAVFWHRQNCARVSDNSAGNADQSHDCNCSDQDQSDQYF